MAETSPPVFGQHGPGCIGEIVQTLHFTFTERCHSVSQSFATPSVVGGPVASTAPRAGQKCRLKASDADFESDSPEKQGAGVFTNPLDDSDARSSLRTVVIDYNKSAGAEGDDIFLECWNLGSFDQRPRVESFTPIPCFQDFERSHVHTSRGLVDHRV